MVVARSRSTTYTSNPLDLTDWTETVDINGRIYQTTYVKGTPEGSWVTTSPEGRKRRRLVDLTTGRLVQTALVDGTGTAIDTPVGYD